MPRAFKTREEVEQKPVQELFKDRTPEDMVRVATGMVQRRYPGHPYKDDLIGDVLESHVRRQWLKSGLVHGLKKYGRYLKTQLSLDKIVEEKEGEGPKEKLLGLAVEPETWEFEFWHDVERILSSCKPKNHPQGLKVDRYMTILKLKSMGFTHEEIARICNVSKVAIDIMSARAATLLSELNK